MPYTAQLTLQFKASHALERIRPDPHWHQWIVQVHLRTEQLEPPGFIVNYFDLVPMVKAILPEGQHLNDCFPFAITAENLAKHFYEQLKPDLPSLLAVTVGEFESFVCTYSPENVLMSVGRPSQKTDGLMV